MHNYSKADYDIINDYFFYIDWVKMFTNIDTNTMWNKLITIVEEMSDKMVPTKILKERSYPKWITIQFHSIQFVYLVKHINIIG